MCICFTNTVKVSFRSFSALLLYSSFISILTIPNRKHGQVFQISKFFTRKVGQVAIEFQFFFNLNFLPPNGILWKISQNSQENSWIWGSFFNFTRSLENVSVEGVFLQNLQFFLEQLFDRTPVNSYSWNL